MYSPPMKTEWSMSTQAGMEARTGQSAQEVRLSLEFKSMQKARSSMYEDGGLGKCLGLLEAVQGLLLQH